MKDGSLFDNKNRRRGDDDDDEDDVPENGITDEVKVGTPAQIISVEFDSKTSYIILSNTESSCFNSNSSSTYNLTNQNITATFDEGEEIVTGSVATDTICLT